MTGFVFTTHVNAARVSDIENALSYIQQRLLGRVPHAIQALCAEATDAFWDAAVANGDVGHLFGVIHTPERFAAQEEANEVSRDWLERENELQASSGDEQEEAFWAFEQTRRDETEQLFRVWLEDQTDAFIRARGHWRDERRTDLRRQFGETAGADHV